MKLTLSKSTKLTCIHILSISYLIIDFDEVEY